MAVRHSLTVSSSMKQYKYVLAERMAWVISNLETNIAYLNRYSNHLFLFIPDKDSCDGDSGGPLQLVENTVYGPRYILIGLVSYGTRTCGIDVPAVYTRVTAFMEMILDQLY